MKKFNTKPIKGEWFSLPEDKEVQILIRPFSLFSLTVIPTAENVDMGEVWNIFNYSILDWKGFEDANGEMECNEKNKRIVYDFDQDLVLFVTDKASTLRETILPGKELKNSQTSQLGETKKQEK